MRNYLLFCLKATNQHGVHSPFIFSFVTRCLYNKHLVTPADFPQTTPLTTKQYILLLKSIRYFQPKRVFTDDPLLQEAMTAFANLNTTLQQNSYDYLFINGNYASYEPFLGNMHNDSVLVINGLQQSDRYALWQQLTQNPQVTAFVDVYTQGFVFIRKEQLHQGFMIRY